MVQPPFLLVFVNFLGTKENWAIGTRFLGYLGHAGVGFVHVKETDNRQHVHTQAGVNDIVILLLLPNYAHIIAVKSGYCYAAVDN